MRGTLTGRLQTFRHLHACSGCFRLERLPGGIRTHWKAPPFHGAHPKATFSALSRWAESSRSPREIAIDARVAAVRGRDHPCAPAARDRHSRARSHRCGGPVLNRPTNGDVALAGGRATCCCSTFRELTGTSVSATCKCRSSPAAACRTPSPTMAQCCITGRAARGRQPLRLLDLQPFHCGTRGGTASAAIRSRATTRIRA